MFTSIHNTGKLKVEDLLYTHTHKKGPFFTHTHIHTYTHTQIQGSLFSVLYKIYVQFPLADFGISW